ncbi:MAG: hypothetical protein ACK5D5_11135 [Bacteroidota bacterium]
MAEAQFVNGIGIFISGMASRHKYSELERPQLIASHKSKHIFRPAGGIVADFGRDDFAKWRTEFEYNCMGAKEKQNVDGSEKIYRNKLNYISWNNFFKLQVETFSGYPYFMIGARCQYLLRNKPEIYQPIINDFKKFHFSWDVGAGFEFMAYGPFRFFTEYHFINDIPSVYKTEQLKIRSLTHELRAGVMYRFVEKSERCNTPIYNDNY